ncbi:unnamed protein product [Rotaria sordida]|uniref:YihY/virulence factor BrkB family protein n=1 Tax=Rotaria sordida TaxID=392033 RepID=A0A819RIB2_9BILA|nr:unnamed protein product [Rotaria sordida]
MLAFNIMITLLPIAITLFGILGLILQDRSQIQQYLKDNIIKLFPSDNTTQIGIKQVVDLAFNQLSKDAGVILALGIIFAIFGTSRLFVVIDKIMTIIYRLSERSFLRQNLMSLCLVFAFIIIVILMLVASSVPSALMNIISGDGARFGIFIAGILISLSIGYSLFQMIYLLTPNKKMSFKKTWCGALVAAITLEIFIILFPLYVRQFMSNYAGQIGFAVLLIIFFYFFAIILIFGAQINAHFFEHCPPLSNGLGTCLSQISEEHPNDNIRESIPKDNNEEHPSIKTDRSQQYKVGWINKWWPSKKRHSIEPLSQENNDV